MLNSDRSARRLFAVANRKQNVRCVRWTERAPGLHKRCIFVCYYSYVHVQYTLCGRSSWSCRNWHPLPLSGRGFVFLPASLELVSIIGSSLLLLLPQCTCHNACAEVKYDDFLRLKWLSALNGMKAAREAECSDRQRGSYSHKWTIAFLQRVKNQMTDIWYIRLLL